jgi:trigger factor
MQVSVERVDAINIVFKGHIPRSLLDEKVLSLRLEAKKHMKEDEIDDETFARSAEGQALHAFIDEGIAQANITAEQILGQPSFRHYDKKEDGLHIEVDVSLRPYIDTSVEYMDIVPNFTLPKTNLSLINVKLSTLALQEAPFTPLKTPRAVAYGDLVSINFNGYLNGRALEGAEQKGYILKIGTNAFIPGFEEKLIGMQTGEEKHIDITFPLNYPTKELAGQKTEFDVTLNEIKEQIALPIDDALAVKVLKDETATLARLKEVLKEQIDTEAFAQLYKRELQPKLIEGLLSKFSFDVPNNVLEQEIDAKVNEKAQQMSQDELKLYQEDKAKFKELRESLKEEASRSIKAALIVDALAKKEGIEVSDDELTASLEHQAKVTGKNAEELIGYYENNNLMTALRVGLTEEKLFRKMLGEK